MTPPAAFGFTTWDGRAGPTLVGTASKYNPSKPGYREGGKLTASGELYDSIGWTAAIQTELRENFGGVHYGRIMKRRSRSSKRAANAPS